jgi:hypothetical protein
LRLAGRDIISARLRLGDLLIEAGLVSPEHIFMALDRLVAEGGRLGDNLVAIGAIDKKTLDAFIHRLPVEPLDIPSSGIDELELMSLLVKLIYLNRLETCREFIDAIKLPYPIVAELNKMAIDRKLLRILGSHTDNPLDMGYVLTDEGKRYTVDALAQLRYVGPAPVAIEEFNYRVNLQKLTNELVTFERIRKGLGDLTFDDSMIEQCGPGINSGRAMLLYGPPGNGKTSVAHALGSVYNDVIYVPYAISVEGQIIRFFDPSIHAPIRRAEDGHDDDISVSFVRSQELDMRWVPCRRPFVVTGGELTLDMLELRYDETGHFYEAPLHVKALGGTFVIDDFGRQLVSPTHLLNRWIVPLENRIDYMKLHTGKSFSIPFEELVVFSTNLEPEDLMDTAFLRRLPYKIEVGAPTLENYKRIFEKECARQGLPLSEEVFETIVYKLQHEKDLDLAGFQPRFIVDQVVATCRFMGQSPHFEPRFIDYALNNLRVHRAANPKGTLSRV